MDDFNFIQQQYASQSNFKQLHRFIISVFVFMKSEFHTTVVQ